MTPLHTSIQAHHQGQFVLQQDPNQETISHFSKRLDCGTSAGRSVHHLYVSCMAVDHLECLKYLLVLNAGRRFPLCFPALLHQAAQNGSLACVAFLDELGIEWSGNEHSGAAQSGDPNTLRYCFGRAWPLSWDDVMPSSLCTTSPGCVQVLYEHGFEQHRSQDPKAHPALLAIRRGSLTCLKLIIQKSGPPKAELIDTAAAAGAGLEMLQYVHGLGGILGLPTVCSAARAGRIEALRYCLENGALQCALENGAPWEFDTFHAALEGGSLECLQFAHQHACSIGFSAAWDCPQASRGPTDWWVYPNVKSLALARYMCDRMNCTWARPNLEFTAKWLAESVDMSTSTWQMVL